MSLSNFQRSRARFEGGKDIKSHKSHLARTATAIRKLRDDASQPGNELDGVFSSDELQTIRDTCQMVDRAIARLESDAREADRIKADYDKREQEAIAEMRTLPHASIDDIVALLGAHQRQPLDHYDMERIRTRHWGKGVLDQLREHAICAIGGLGRSCAYDGKNPAEFRQQIAERLPQMKQQHADLIRELSTLAVAQQMEKTL